MKRSELKEAIKAEIKSVLSEGPGIFGTSIRDLDQYNPEDFEEAKFIKFKGDSDDNKMEVEAEREMNTPDGELKVYTVRTDDGLQSYTADQVELVEGDLNEESRFPTQADIDDIENSGNIDIAYDKAMKLLKSLMNKSVSFSDVREDDDNMTPEEIEDFKLRQAVHRLKHTGRTLDDERKAAERKAAIREEEDDDAKDKKAYRGAAKIGKKKSARDKAIDAYNEIGGSKEVKAKAKGAKEGDREALNWLLSNQKVIKAYNDIPK